MLTARSPRTHGRTLIRHSPSPQGLTAWLLDLATSTDLPQAGQLSWPLVCQLNHIWDNDLH